MLSPTANLVYRIYKEGDQYWGELKTSDGLLLAMESSAHVEELPNGFPDIVVSGENGFKRRYLIALALTNQGYRFNFTLEKFVLPGLGWFPTRLPRNESLKVQGNHELELG